MTKTLFVGVDICEDSFEAFFMDQDERKLAPPSKYPNIPDGFRRFREDCIAISRILGERVPIVIGMESTGNFHRSLESFLRAQRCFTVRVINPYRIKEFRKAHFKLSKTDRIDASIIAKFLKVFPPEPSFSPSIHQLAIRSLTRFRRILIEERTRYINRLRKNLRLLFPGYKRIIGEKITPDFLTFISLYETEESVPHPFRKFLPLLNLIQDRALAELLKKEMKWTAKRIMELDEQIEDLEREIVRLIDTHYPNHPLFSVPGLGKITVATIIGEIGDSVERFPTVKEFIGYIGLYPVSYQSGKNKIFFQMTWKGNKWLKMALILATASGRRSNPAIRNFYNRLRDRGKSKKAAGGAVARKIACIVYAILRDGIPWNGEIALRGIQRGEEMVQRNFPQRTEERAEAGRLNLIAAHPARAQRLTVSIRTQRPRDNTRPTRRI